MSGDISGSMSSRYKGGFAKQYLVRLCQYYRQYVTKCCHIFYDCAFRITVVSLLYSGNNHTYYGQHNEEKLSNAVMGKRHFHQKSKFHIFGGSFCRNLCSAFFLRKKLNTSKLRIHRCVSFVDLM